MENKVTTVLSDKVAAFKLIARDALRMNLIVPRLSNISNLEGDVKSVNESIASHQKTVDVETYEISKLDADHPNYEAKKKVKEDKIKDLTEVIANYNKEIVELNKAIQEQKDGIAKIEAGEVKVSLSDLNELVATMIRQSAIVQVTA